MMVVDLDKKNRTVASLLRLAKKQPLVLTRKGKPVVAVLDVGRDDLETLSLRANARFRAYLRQCRERHEREGGILLEDLRIKHGLSPRARQAKNGK